MTDTVSLPRSVLAYIRRLELLRPGDRVAAAVSGGADSVALLRVMLELRAELGIVLSVAHFNHKIRGEASDGDELFVSELAAAHDLELHVSSADVPSYAAANKVSLETGARELRYAFFHELIGSGAVSKVMTAHTLDDQAETVLMRIMRGTGTSGLAGIYPKVEVSTGHSRVTTRSSGWIIRPLLGTRRRDIEDYLHSLAQPWCEDATNADTQHTRNRVRHVLLPLMDAEFDGNVRQRLAELAEIARAEEVDWEHSVNLSEFRADDEKHSLDATKLSRLSVALQRRLIRQLGVELNLRLDFETIDAIQRMAVESTSNYGAQPRRYTTLALPDGWRVTPTISRRPSGGKDAVLLVIERAGQAPRHENRIAWATGTRTDYEVAFRWPGEIKVLGSCLRARLVQLSGEPTQLKAGLELSTGAAKAGLEEGTDAGKCGYNLDYLLDPGRLLPELTLRNWRPGDQFWPARTSGPKKVKELLQRRHVTGAERASWPVLLSGDEIMWMRGFRVSERYRAGEGTEAALLIEEFPVSPEGNSGKHR